MRRLIAVVVDATQLPNCEQALPAEVLKPEGAGQPIGAELLTAGCARN